MQNLFLIFAYSLNIILRNFLTMYINSDFSRLEINLNGCQANYKYFRSRLEDKTKLLVLVKANAYGHGAVEFATLMEDAGADYLAVAYPVEGIELRQAGIKSPIIVLTAGTDSFEQIVNYGLEPGIPNLCSLKELCSVLEKRGLHGFPVHIKIDSGMHRLGFMTDELKELEDYLKDCPYVKVKSIYSHLAAADDPSCDDFTEGQVSLFKNNADRLSESIGYRPMYHILNSAGIERFPQYQFDMVRLGIGIYGVSAIPGNELAPVASFKCKVLQVAIHQKSSYRAFIIIVMYNSHHPHRHSFESISLIQFYLCIQRIRVNGERIRYLETGADQNNVAGTRRTNDRCSRIGRIASIR